MIPIYLLSLLKNASLAITIYCIAIYLFGKTKRSNQYLYFISAGTFLTVFLPLSYPA